LTFVSGPVVTVVSRSCQPLRYVRHSWKPSVIEAWFQRPPIGNGLQAITWPLTSRDLEWSNSWPRYA